jgi:outer membrane protein OmpA-like peptidoglycan-associated protein/phage gp37-like protein
VSASPAIERSTIPKDSGIDRKALAGVLLQIARDLKPELIAEQNAAETGDVRLEQLRTLLVGHEIEVLARLQSVIEDPEKLAAAVGRVLPTAIAEASADARLGQVLVPALEKATERSIASNPRTLVDILYPLIVPTIGKSIRESIAATFQSLNQTLKYSLTLRGLKWRWEAWRSGTSFAAIVLKHTLVYQVEHVFLIHRHTGLLISHVAAQDAASQDPQLISSMLMAIQDFVKDSFSGAGQGVDTLMLGELKLWCEPGPFAMLVAVIRGDPPEEFHDTLRQALTRMHAERHAALESFDGDGSSFADIEAELRECLIGRQRARPAAARFGRLIFTAWLIVMLALAGAFGWRWWDSGRLWRSYIEQLRAEPGIVVTEVSERDGKLTVSGLRDPLAIDPQAMLKQMGINPDTVVSRWERYEAMQPQFVAERLKSALEPPPSVSLAVEGDRAVAQGSAPTDWLARAKSAAKALPAGAPTFDVSAVQDTDEAGTRLWNGYIARLGAEPGIVVTENDRRDGKFFVSGLRDPLSADPAVLLGQAGVDPAEVTSRWTPYQSLEPQFVLRRIEVSLAPPASVALSIVDGQIVGKGSAPSRWLDEARMAARLLPPGAPAFDLSGVEDADAADTALWDGYVGRLRAEPGIVVTEAGERDGGFFVSGLRDPLAADPLALLAAAGIDPARVTARFQPYQALDAAFVIERLRDSLTPPPGVTLAIEGERIVARGAAPADWLGRAREAARTLPAGAPQFDLAAVSDSDAAGASLWADYIARLTAQPGIVITAEGKRDGKFFIAGLRDPLATDPAALLAAAAIEPGQVSAQWTPYQSLHPLFVLKRLEASLDPPSSVALRIMGDRITADGSESSAWLERARLAARDLPPGAPGFDVSGVRDTDEADASRWAGYLDRLGAEPGIVITSSSERDGKFYVTGLRDPLAADPQALLADAGIDPVRVVGRWAPYQALDAEFVLTRLKASLDLPPTVTLTVEGQQIVAQGSASPRWLERARLAGRMLPAGGPDLDLHEVRDLFDGAIGSLRDAIEERVVHFDVGGSLPATGQDEMLDAQAEDIKRVAELSATMGVTTRVTLIGHADSVGQGTSNLSLSVARAEAVRALLKKRGVNPDNLAVRGAGAMEPLLEETSDAAKSANRRVSFSLGIE